MRGAHVFEVLAPGDRGWGLAELPKTVMFECWANVECYLEDEMRPELPGLHWGVGPVPEVPEVPAAWAADTGIDQLHSPFPLSYPHHWYPCHYSHPELWGI